MLSLVLAVYSPIIIQAVLIILILVTHSHVHDILMLALEYDSLLNLIVVRYARIDSLIALCPR